MAAYTLGSLSDVLTDADATISVRRSAGKGGAAMLQRLEANVTPGASTASPVVYPMVRVPSDALVKRVATVLDASPVTFTADVALGYPSAISASSVSQRAVAATIAAQAFFAAGHVFGNDPVGVPVDLTFGNALAATPITVRLATAAILPNTPTYANGTAGVGATLTSSASTTLTVDGATVNNNDLVLVQTQASAFQNGVYKATIGGSAWVLTRVTNFDQPVPGEVAYGATVTATAGTANTGLTFQLQGNISPIVIGTTALNFTLVPTNAAVYLPSKALQPLWKAAGFASNPGGFFDVILVTTASNSGAAVNVALQVDYVPSAD